jgi:predicted molibdopterin-dependent oxidoreductase YjgC
MGFSYVTEKPFIIAKWEKTKWQRGKPVANHKRLSLVIDQEQNASLNSVRLMFNLMMERGNVYQVTIGRMPHRMVAEDNVTGAWDIGHVP